MGGNAAGKGGAAKKPTGTVTGGTVGKKPTGVKK